MVPQGSGRVTADGEAQDVRSDERVAIAVAPDPRAHGDRGVGVDRPAECRDGTFQLGRDLRDHVEQARGPVVPKRLADLVGDAQLGQAQHGGLPEHQDLQRQPLLDHVPVGGVFGLRRPLDQLVVDDRQHVEDRLPPHFRRMGREHRDHTKVADQAGELGWRRAGGGEPIERRGDGADVGTRPTRAVVPSPALVVHIFGGVREDGQPAERPDQVELIGDRASGERDRQGVQRAPPVTPRGDGPAPYVLDQLEHLVAGLLAHDVTQESPEEPDVVTECRVLGVPRFGAPHGLHGGATPQPQRGTGACSTTAASGCEFSRANRVPHSR